MSYVRVGARSAQVLRLEFAIFSFVALFSVSSYVFVFISISSELSICMSVLPWLSGLRKLKHCTSSLGRLAGSSHQSRKDCQMKYVFTRENKVGASSTYSPQVQLEVCTLTQNLENSGTMELYPAAN